MPNADLVERLGGCGESADELFGGGRSKLLVEMNDEQVLDAEAADELELVLRGGEEARRAFWSKNSNGMRIESHYYGRPIDAARVVERSVDHCLVPQMYPVENTDREDHRSRHVRQF